ncbi:MAG: copper homeostasis membrane protein CopD [Pseudomonadota bacterium]|nr:copper homeostasis membrane protein CopD [Pseudomonadota bacterium]
MEGLSIAIRLGLYLDLMALFGLPLFGLYGLRGAERSPEGRRALRLLYAALAVAGLLLSGFAILVLTASMLGVPLAQVDSPSISMLVFETSIGLAWQARMAALLLLLGLTLTADPASRVGSSVLALLGGIALGTFAWSGHGAMTEGTAGTVHLLSDIAHLLGAGAWLGALMALSYLLFRPRRIMTSAHVDVSHRALASFAFVGTTVVTILVITGLINSWFLIGLERAGSILTSLYGQLLVAKLLLFLAMLGLAAINRYRMTPALEAAIARGDHNAAVTGLRTSLAAETGSAVAILALVAWLGTLAPPAAM